MRVPATPPGPDAAAGIPCPGRAAAQPRHRCRAVRFVSPPGRVTALASFPGSGNTWVRHLLQQLTGLATGSIYLDTELACTGFPGENRRDGSVLVVKTHEFTRPHQYEAVVVVVRDVVAANLAEFNRLGGGHTGRSRHLAAFPRYLRQHSHLYQGGRVYQSTCCCR